MRFGFFGNTNNYPFGLARALIDKGYEVRFLVDREYGLHRPETRFSELEKSYPDWIFDVSPMTAKDILLPTTRNIRSKRWVADCDVLILNQYGPALFYQDPRPKIVILAGSDFHLCGEKDYFSTPGFKNLPLLRACVRSFRKILVSRQRAGITRAALVDYVWPGILHRDDGLFTDLEIEDARRTSFLLVDLKTCTYCPAPRNKTLRITSGTRLNWEVFDNSGSINELDSKHANTMLLGLAKFARETGMQVDIRLAKKGLHTPQSERLAEELGLAPFVTWMEELSQVQILDEFRAADIVLEQFNPKSCLGMAGRDAMAIGRPVIGFANTKVLERIYGCPIPVCEASTEEELSYWLTRLGRDCELRESIGYKASQFARRYFSAENAATICLNALSSLHG